MRASTLALALALVGCVTPTAPPEAWRSDVIHERCAGGECVVFLDVGPARTFDLTLSAGGEPLTAGRAEGAASDLPARVHFWSRDGDFRAGISYLASDSRVTLPIGSYDIEIIPSVLSMRSGWPSRFRAELEVDAQTDEITIDVFRDGRATLSRRPELTFQNVFGQVEDETGQGWVSACGAQRRWGDGEPTLELPASQCSLEVRYHLRSPWRGRPTGTLTVRHPAEALVAGPLEALVDERLVAGRLPLPPLVEDGERPWLTLLAEGEIGEARSISLALAGLDSSHIFLPEELPETVVLRASILDGGVERCRTEWPVSTDRWATERLLEVSYGDEPCVPRPAPLTAVVEVEGTEPCALRPFFVIDGSPVHTELEPADERGCRLIWSAQTTGLEAPTFDVAVGLLRDARSPAESRTMSWARDLPREGASRDLGRLVLRRTVARYRPRIELPDGHRLNRPRNVDFRPASLFPNELTLPSDGHHDPIDFIVRDPSGELSHYEVPAAEVTMRLWVEERVERGRSHPVAVLRDWEVASYVPEIVAAVTVTTVDGQLVWLRSTSLRTVEDALDLGLVGTVRPVVVRLSSNGVPIDRVFDLEATAFVVRFARPSDESEEGVVAVTAFFREGEKVVYLREGTWTIELLGTTFTDPPRARHPRRTLEL